MTAAAAIKVPGKLPDLTKFPRPSNVVDDIASSPIVTGWWMFLNSLSGGTADVTLSGSQILTVRNRIAGSSLGAFVRNTGTGPTLASPAAFGGRNAGIFNSAADNSLILNPGPDLTGDWSMAILCAPSLTTAETVLQTGADTGHQLRMDFIVGNSGQDETFQLFRDLNGVNYKTRVGGGLDTTPVLLFIDKQTIDATHATYRIARGLNDPTVFANISGNGPAANAALRLGRNIAATNYLGGGWGELILMSARIHDAANATLKSNIAKHASAWWGAGVL